MNKINTRLKKIIKISLFRKSIQNLVAEVFLKLSNFLVVVMYARYIDKDTYGEFLIIQNLVLFLWWGVDLGTGMYSIREISRGVGGARFISQIVFIRYCSVILISILAVIAYSQNLVILSIPANIWIFGLFYLWVYPLYLDWVYKGLQNFAPILKISILVGGIHILLCLVVVFFNLSVKFLILFWVIPYFFGTLVFLSKSSRFFLRLNLFRLGFVGFLHHLRISLKFGATSVFWALFQFLPIYVLARYENSETVAEFGVSFKLLVIYRSVITMMFVPIYPSFSQQFELDYSVFFKKADRFFIVCFSIASIVALSNYFFSTFVIELFFGSSYENIVGILKIFSICLFFGVFRAFTTIVLNSMTLENIPANSSILACLIFPILFICTQINDYMTIVDSATWSYTIAEVSVTLYLIFLYIYHRKETLNIGLGTNVK